jgi:hypothetical protein
VLRRDSVTPTASHIADQAACSVRSIFERFSDLDTLRLAVADYAIAQGQAEAAARNVDGDRPTRIQSHVETRARACEKWLPLWRIIVSLDQVAELRARVVMVRRANITRMRLMYGPELSCLFEPVRTVVVCVSRVDQLRKLGPDAPLLRPFDGGRPRRLAVRDPPNAAVGGGTASRRRFRVSEVSRASAIRTSLSPAPGNASS